MQLEYGRNLRSLFLGVQQKQVLKVVLRQAYLCFNEDWNVDNLELYILVENGVLVVRPLNIAQRRRPVSNLFPI